MKLLVGLGNPGAQYARNRHNIGFMALDRIAADHGFGPWKARFQGLVSEGRLGSVKCLLLKPQTFMNLSGQSVGEAMRYNRLEPADVTVFHDELDLSPGRCRVKAGGGHAGHNGLRSIIAHVGEGFARVRLGIGHPGRKEAVAGYVLHDFARADEDWLDDLMRGLSDGAPALVAGDSARFLNAVAAHTAPARNAGPRRAPGDAPPVPAAGAHAATAARTQSAAPGAASTPASPPAPTPADEAPRSALQRLVDRFR